MLPRLCPIAFALALLGCGSEHAGAASSSPPASAAASTPAPIASASSAPRCAEGSFRCEGDKLLRCTAQGGDEPVKTCFDIERCDAQKGSCEPACPEHEVYIPATGPAGFTMGKGMASFGFGSRASHNAGTGRADTPHKVILTRPFCMDENEVTARKYEVCVNEKGCKIPKISDPWLTYQRKLDMPENMIDWPRSKYYCEQYGQSLPTEAQWEWAATGGDGRSWPWGNEEPTCEHADFTMGNLVSPGGDSGCHGGGPSNVGTHLKGDRVWPTGHIHDLGGNVWEWCLDSYIPYPATEETDPLPLQPNTPNHVVRGGGWNRSNRGIMSAFRGAAISTYTVPGLGFRCVRNPKGAAPAGQNAKGEDAGAP